MNTPKVKANVKLFAALFASFAGLASFYNLARYPCILSTDVEQRKIIYSSKIDKMTLLCGKILLIINGLVSKVGVKIVSPLLMKIASAEKWEKIFGPNINFVGNWKHPRHLASFIAIALALPIFLQIGVALKNKLWPSKKTMRIKTIAFEKPLPYFTDTKVRIAVVLTTLMSRPLQHIGNQCVNALIR